MVTNHHFTRVDTLELKDLIYQKIGHQRAEMYFDQLKRFLCLKLSKVDFDRSCIRTIGRENIALHNQLIRSIVQNACHAKIPPQKARKVEGLSVKVTNGYQKSYLQSLYGDAFPQSPRKCRSPVSRDRKFRDRPSPLGPLGKSHSITCEETVSRIQEQQSTAELHSFCSRPPVDVGQVEDGEEVEQFAELPSTPRWHSVTAPLGVSYNTGGTHKARCSGFEHHNTCQSSGGLPDTISLRSHLEKKLALEGVGISMDAANVLNHGLDVFLKRIIGQCTGIARSRWNEPQVLGRQSDGPMVSGSKGPCTSMLDFRVTVESNPIMLGEDWPTQLERICNYASQELL